MQVHEIVESKLLLIAKSIKQLLGDTYEKQPASIQKKKAANRYA